MFVKVINSWVTIIIYYCMTGRAIQENMVAVLARPQEGTIHNLRTEYSPVLPNPKGMK